MLFFVLFCYLLVVVVSAFSRFVAVGCFVVIVDFFFIEFFFGGGGGGGGLGGEGGSFMSCLRFDQFVCLSG